MSRPTHTRAELIERLTRHEEERTLVRISRSCDPHPLQGYVVALGGPWVVLSRLDDAITLDGYAAVRLGDITGVRTTPNATFVRRALKLRGEWPPPAPSGDLDLRRRRDLLRSVAGLAPLVTIHVQHRDPLVCFIGVPVGFKAKTVLLLEISPQAHWDRTPTPYRLGDITSIEWGGRYEQALVDVAGPPPGAPAR